MRTTLLCALLILGALPQAPASSLQPPASDKASAGQAYDIVILNGHIVDGTGSPWYAADVGIRDGRIAAIGRLAGAAAKQTIDASGRVVAPGFIDMLGQSELTVLVDPHLPSKIFQGITTEITGEGGSAAPLNDAIVKADKVDYDHFKITPDWRTFAQYFARVEKQGLGINMAHLVGATQVRRMVLGDADTQPAAADLERMKALVRDAMTQGAVGLSTSLQYPPAPTRRRRNSSRSPPRPRSTAASTRRTCGPRRGPCSRRSTRRSASAARRRSRWRSGTSRRPASATGAA